MVDEEQVEAAVLDAASIAAAALNQTDACVSLRAILLHEYLDPEGQTHIAYYYTGEASFADLFGLLTVSLERVKAQFHESS